MKGITAAIPYLDLMRMPSSIRFAAVSLVLLAGTLCLGQTSGTVTLTFEGLKDQESILNYYNGGYGGSGSGPGPNYGITFGSDSRCIVAQSAGGLGDFSGNPSGVSVAFFSAGAGVLMNVPTGFKTGFSFYYAAANTPGRVSDYDGLNGTGNVLATLTLPITGAGCSGSVFERMTQVVHIGYPQSAHRRVEFGDRSGRFLSDG